MKPDEDRFAAAVLPADRRARLRGRPSGLKGRYRDRCTTGLRPALDPGAATALHPTAGTGRRTAPARPNRTALGSYQDQTPTNKVSAIPGDCHPAVGPAAASSGRDVVIEQFTGYLIGERGLAAATIVNYRAVAGRFLAGCRWESGALVEVSSEWVNSFVLGEAGAAAADR